MKDQKWSTALNIISIYTNLKCSLMMISATSLLFYSYCLTFFKVICTIKEKVKRNRSLIHVYNLRELKSINCWNLRFLIDITIRVLVFNHIITIELKSVLNLFMIILWSLLSLFCLVMKSNLISSSKVSKSDAWEAEVIVLKSISYFILRNVTRI